MTDLIEHEDVIRIGDSAFGDRINVRALLRDFKVGAATNGLNYSLSFEISPGYADAIAAAMGSGACRLWWQPDGATKEALISEGAIPAATGYSVKFDSSGESQHHHIALRLTRPDVALGVGTTLGLLTLPDYEAMGVPGMLGLEPNQLTTGL